MRILLIIALCLGVTSVSAQNDTLDWNPSGTKTYGLKKRINGFSLGGYYRFYSVNRSLVNPWSVLPDNQFANTPPFVLGVGDVYRDPPILLMTASLRPGGGAAIGMDYALYSNFTGSNGSVPYNLNLGINVYGTVPTEVATFGFQLGGIHWAEVSDMVFSSFVGYNRFSLFERWAWEGIAQASERAETFIETGDISRDSRWARQAFKGVLLDVYDLPGGVSGRILYGKTPNTATFGSALPTSSYGGRLRKAFDWGYIGANTMNYLIFTDPDSVARDAAGINIHTLSAVWENEKYRIAAEGGVAKRYNVLDTSDWGEGLRLNFTAKQITPWLSGDIDVFRLSPDFVNLYGNFLSANTQISVVDQAQIVTGGGGASNFSGSITDVGQVLNNRQGGSINLMFDLGNTNISIGNMVSRDVDRLTSRLAFGHKINGLTLSRFAPFASNIGPYGRWTSFFRGVAEDIFITETDSLGLPLEHLGFNTLQLQLKQKLELKEHPVYFVYTGMLGSVSTGWNALPVMSEKAYLRTTYHEFDLITPIRSWLDITLALGLETIQGNNKTNNIYYIDESGALAGATVDTNPTLTFEDYDLNGSPIAGSSYVGTTTAAAGPVDQRSRTIGIGFDIDISENSGLYLRHRRFFQRDENFTQDDISGNETTIEFKVFF